MKDRMSRTDRNNLDAYQLSRFRINLIVQVLLDMFIERVRYLCYASIMPEKQANSREQQRLATNKAIKSAAREAMQTDGFQRTTIRKIASLAGVSTGAVMVHFRSKEELLFEVFYDDIQQISNRVMSNLDLMRPLNESLKSIGESFLDGYSREPEVYADFLEHSLFAIGVWGDRFREQVEEVGKRIATLFVAAAERGEIDRERLDVRADVTAFFAHYYFVLMNQIKSRFANLDTGKQQLAMLIDQHCRGLSK